MDVTFKTPALAALCNREDRLTRRWGEEMGRTIGRRLLDLAAADADCLDCVPGARVTGDASGETTITFGEAIVIKGTISGPRGDGSADPDRIAIGSIRVIKGDR